MDQALLQLENLLQRPLRGCTDAEINHLEKSRGLRLPKTYRSYLKVAGKEPEGILTAREVRLNDQEAFQATASLHHFHQEGIAADEKPFQLPANLFAFASRYEEQYLVFFVNGDDDPPVYRHWLEVEAFEKVRDRFSDWLIETIRCHMGHHDGGKSHSPPK